MFYDQREKKYIVAFRGTNKNNLIDWKNNINNQLPDANVLTAPSYYSANLLGFRLKDSSPPIEYTGHSKGGGEVYEALAASSKSKATVFNTAGPSPRISEVIKGEIASRTQNYQVGGEMLNLMQDQTDPQRTIENMKWLKKQVSDGWKIAIKITEQNNLDINKKEELTKKILASYSRSGVSMEEGRKEGRKASTSRIGSYE